METIHSFDACLPHWIEAFRVSERFASELLDLEIDFLHKLVSRYPMPWTYLGCGSEAVAYRVGSGEVLRIQYLSKDWSPTFEYHEKLRSEDNPFFVKVFDTLRSDSGNLLVSVLEHLTMLDVCADPFYHMNTIGIPALLTRKMTLMTKLALILLISTSYGELRYNISYYMKDIDNSCLVDKLLYAMSFIEQFCTGNTIVDIHEGNLGYRDGQLVIFDPLYLD